MRQLSCNITWSNFGSILAITSSKSQLLMSLCWILESMNSVTNLQLNLSDVDEIINVCYVHILGCKFSLPRHKWKNCIPSDYFLMIIDFIWLPKYLAFLLHRGGPRRLQCLLLQPSDLYIIHITRIHSWNQVKFILNFP